MILSLPQADLIGGALGFAFTIALLSYAIGDNPLYRLALHAFVGVATGYVALVVLYQVLAPRLITPLVSGGVNSALLALVPLVLFLFLILKLSPRTAALGNISIGFLVGVGTAVALGGAITGTLLPQIRLAWLAGEDLVVGGLILIGTVTTLLTFQFWLRGASAAGVPERVPAMRVLAQIGQGFLVVALGAIYAGMILSGIAILSDRVGWMAGWIQQFLP
jgi:hypothetical protein